jgi:DNA-directed RNA polymerase specialized sigma24 family protein
MNESMVRKIALFYFFAFLDERQSIVATKKVIQQINKNSSLKDLSENYFDKNPSIVIHEVEKNWKKLKETRNLSFTNFDMEAGWLLPEDLNLGLWRQFLKDSTENELVSVILSQILKFSDDEISKGLGLTIGTVRMRTGHGLRKLGALRI